MAKNNYNCVTETELEAEKTKQWWSGLWAGVVGTILTLVTIYAGVGIYGSIRDGIISEAVYKMQMKTQEWNQVKAQQECMKSINGYWAGGQCFVLPAGTTNPQGMIGTPDSRDMLLPSSYCPYSNGCTWSTDGNNFTNKFEYNQTR